MALRGSTHQVHTCSQVLGRLEVSVDAGGIALVVRADDITVFLGVADRRVNVGVGGIVGAGECIVLTAAGTLDVVLPVEIVITGKHVGCQVAVSIEELVISGIEDVALHSFVDDMCVGICSSLLRFLVQRTRLCPVVHSLPI